MYEKSNFQSRLLLNMRHTEWSKKWNHGRQTTAEPWFNYYGLVMVRPWLNNNSTMVFWVFKVLYQPFSHLYTTQNS